MQRWEGESWMGEGESEPQRTDEDCSRAEFVDMLVGSGTRIGALPIRSL